MNPNPQLVETALELEEERIVSVNNLHFKLYHEGAGYILETNEEYYPRRHPSRAHEILTISMGTHELFAHDALNLRYPNPRYIFSRLASTEKISLYNTAIFSFSITNERIKQKFSFTIENNITINIDYIENDGITYTILKSSEEMDADRLIGLTLRYRHSLAFLKTNISSSSFVILGNDNDEFLVTYGARVSVKHDYSVFFKPCEWDYFIPNQTVMNDHTPFFDIKFTKIFINRIMVDTCLYNVLLLLSEKAKYDIYSSTATSFVALEMLATKFVSSTKLPKSIKNSISKVKKDFDNHLSSELKKGSIDKETYDHISKKLNSLSQPTNADKLASLFTMYNIELDEQEEKILILRNKYLHGSITDDIEKEMKDFVVYLSACRLAASLILKICDYSGIICKFDKIALNQISMPPVEEVFVKI